ncbi:MAG TPA: ACT domain-containing protein [Thermoleophilaceae bacterium]|jgi:glycine cleavage system transcriptional repressor
MPQLAVSAIGRDRPGIVAAVSATLLDHGVNLEDSQMTILRGHFTMMLVVAPPEGADLGALRTDLDAVRERLGLEALLLSELEDVDPSGEPVPTHIVTLYGADHPGIVHAAAAALAEHGVTITDLTTKLAGEGEDQPPLYALMMEIAPPPSADEGAMEEALRRVGADQGVEVALRPLESDAL